VPTASIKKGKMKDANPVATKDSLWLLQLVKRYFLNNMHTHCLPHIKTFHFNVKTVNFFTYCASSASSNASIHGLTSHA